MVCAGERVRLSEIRGGCGLTHRLTELGLTPGVEMEVLQQSGMGPLILSVRDTRLALGRGMAHRVLVHPLYEDNRERSVR
jgi:Fe2+ transport system protein FeoA